MSAQHALDRVGAALDRGDARRRRRGLPPPQVLVVTPDARLVHGDLDRRFHCASVDKVMSATLVGMLVEHGAFGFDTPLGDVLPRTDLDGLPAAPGVDLARDTTVGHLLTHTSGLPDFIDPPKGQSSPAALTRADLDPDRRWTRSEILDAVRGMRAVGAPGECFHYSDTAYVLLGRIAEEATGTAYPALLAERIFTPLGMNDTTVPFDDSLSRRTLDDLALPPIHLGGRDRSRSLALSAGWGSAVTTPDDLVAFQDALHSGRIVHPRTVDHLAARHNRMRAGIHYGAGMVTLRFGELMPLVLRGLPEPVGGLGLSAVHAFHYRAQRAHVVLNFHSDREMNASFRTHVQIARALVRG